MANEKRLIDLQTAIKRLRGECIAKYPFSYYFGLLAAADEIAKIPTVDAVEVVHGRWEQVDHDGSWRVDRCSICHRRMHYVDYDQPYPYCPNCGAKMDGERKEDGKE